MRDDVPVELPRDVFLLLLDAYREEVASPILRAFAAHEPQRQTCLALIDANVEGWRVRYECAVDREGASTVPPTE